VPQSNPKGDLIAWEIDARERWRSAHQAADLEYLKAEGTLNEWRVEQRRMAS
jgi:aryl carrier-like protein